MEEPGRPLANEELVHRTTRKLVAQLEGVVFIAQAGSIVFSAFVDKLLPNGQIILYAVALGHLVLAVLSFQGRGPFHLGGAWTVLWFGAVVMVPLMMAHLVAPTEYAASPACVQLCTYPAPAAILFSFYPWMAFRLARVRTVVDLAMLVVVVVEPLLIVLAIHHNHPSPTNYVSVAASSVGVFLGYFLGKTVGIICRRATNEQLKEKDEFHRANYDFLHSHAMATIDAITEQYGPEAAGIDKLIDFDQAVWRRRVEMLLGEENVRLNLYFEEHARRFEQVLRRYPQVGLLTAPRAVAGLIDRALGDLLRNAARFGRNVTVYFDISEGGAVLDVVDDGPGFPTELIDNPVVGLHRLRDDVRRLGGDLVRIEELPHGSRMRLTLPPGALDPGRRVVRHARAAR
jgi:hypothetical protein